MNRNGVIVLVCGALLLLNSNAALTQSTVKIRGRVFAAAGEPLAGAQILVLSTGHGAVSGEDGRFIIEDLYAGEYSLSASHIGFHDQRIAGITVRPDITAVVEFVLQPRVLPLPAVIVAADAARPAAGAFQTILNADQIAASQAITVAELLGQQPGVEILDDGSGSKRISIRGSDTGQVLVLLDGRPLNSAFSGDADLSRIPLSRVQRVVVQRGGGSHRLGSGALAGAVEITSKVPERNEIRLRGDWGAYGKRSLQTTLSGGRGTFRALANFDGTWQRGDFPFTYSAIDGSSYRDRRRNAELASRAALARLEAAGGPHRGSLQLSLNRVDRGLPGLIHALTPYADASGRRSMILARYSHRGRAGYHELSVSRLRSDNEYRHLPPPDAPPRDRIMPPYHSLNRQADDMVSWQATLGPLSGQLSLRRVRFAIENRLVPSPADVGKTDHRNLSAAVSRDFTLSLPGLFRELRLQPALRYDHLKFDHQGTQSGLDEFSPHIAAILSHRGNVVLQLQASLGRSFRAPSFADLFFQDFRIEGNHNLLPEISSNRDIGVRYGLPFLGWLDLEAAYFHQDIDNHIIWELGSFATFRPANSHALLQGFEFQLDWALWSDRVALAWHHGIVAARNRSGDRVTHDRYLTYRPSYLSKLRLRVAVKPLEIVVQKRWVGRRFVTAANTIRLPPYTVDDLSMRWRRRLAPSMEMQVFLSAVNLFDSDYEITERAPQPGRHVRIGLELNR